MIGHARQIPSHLLCCLPVLHAWSRQHSTAREMSGRPHPAIYSRLPTSALYGKHSTSKCSSASRLTGRMPIVMAQVPGPPLSGNLSCHNLPPPAHGPMGLNIGEVTSLADTDKTLLVVHKNVRPAKTGKESRYAWQRAYMERRANRAHHAPWCIPFP